MNEYGPIFEALKEGKVAQAEGLALDVVGRFPLEAQPWVFLGQALLKQGYGTAARKVFDRAWLLDPEASWVAQIQLELQGTPEGSPRADIDSLLAVEKNKKVSAAILAKNEARCIERCLKSLAGAVEEIVVIDTGSTDGTQDIVRRHPGVKLVEIPWREDFAAARNTALSYLEGDWVLWIDADEHLHPEDVDCVRTVAALFDRPAESPLLLNIGQLNQTGGEFRANYTMSRLFPLKQGITYRGRVHEQPIIGMGSLPTPCRPVRVRVFHDGYQPDVMRAKDKVQRNLRLLEQMVQEEPGDPGWWFFYARETMVAGDVDAALERFRKAEAVGESRAGFSRLLDVYMFQVGIHMKQNRLAEAEQVCRKALGYSPGFPDAHYHLAQIRMRQSLEMMREIKSHLESAKTQFASYRGPSSPDPQIAQWKADALLGELAIWRGRLDIARAVYKVVLRKQPDSPGLKEKLAFIEDQRRRLNEASE
jgi:tetratricopeptide (TPR) repeat protein